jgi:hypothetical protein
MIVHETQNAIVVFSERELRNFFYFFPDSLMLRYIFINFLYLLLDPILLNCDVVAKVI